MIQLERSAYIQGQDHLTDELQWLGLLLLREVLRFRFLHAQPNEGLQGIYIADTKVDRLLSEVVGGVDPTFTGPEIAEVERRALDLRALIDRRVAASSAAGNPVPLERLSGLFGLGALDRGALLAAAAPDLDDRFETLYAYLHDDIGRRRPTIGLALGLLCRDRDAAWAARATFGSQGRLVQHALVRIDKEPPFLSRPLRVDDRILAELLEEDARLDASLEGLVRLRRSTPDLDALALSRETKTRLLGLAGMWRAWESDRSHRPIAVFEGLQGSGRSDAAAAVAGLLGRPTLELRFDALVAAGAGPDQRALLQREAILSGGLLVLAGGQGLAEGDPQAIAARRLVEPILVDPPTPVVVVSDRPLNLAGLLEGVRTVTVTFAAPPFHDRVLLWAEALKAEHLAVVERDVEQVANKFILSAGRIREAAAAAANLLRLRGDDAADAPDLHSAARGQSHHGLTDLARKIQPIYGWKDIVLPSATIRHLREISAAVEYRHLVFSSWGWERRLSRGRGLNVLFSGPSGAGKTMAAEVLANELNLDLYAIDLATVVSKYIGETEKNLARIFAEAQSSNAILFFDEADALFGKRLEVRDAHDRYANIEVAYLLQLMEEYEGISILATNLSKSFDEAFERRMQYVVELPFPDEGLRERIWRVTFPTETPVAPTVDFPFLAKRFELAGGNIKSAAVAAAVLAAADGGVVGMGHLAVAVAREYLKLGKLPSQRDFGPYYGAVLEHLGSGK